MATILVVDDDPALRSTVAQVLADAGHVVREAIDGAHALAVASEPPPDLVLSDISMPSLSGVELANALADSAPGTPVLLMSGACPAPADSPSPCLAKPFSADRLLALVDDLLVS